MKKATIFIIAILNANFIFSQSIISASPSCANAGQTLDVTITGRNTEFTQGSGSIVYFGNYFAGASSIFTNSVTVLTDTTLIANVTVNNSTSPQLFDITLFGIQNSYGKLNAFYVNAPSNPYIKSVSPNDISAGQTLDVTITGKNTEFSQGSGSSAIYFGNYFDGASAIFTNSVTVLTDTTLIANVTVTSNTSPQLFNVTFLDSQDNSYGLLDALNVNAPSNPYIKSVSPNDISAGQTLDVTITGKNTEFSQGSGSSAIYFGNYFDGASAIFTNSVTVLTDTTLIANITATSSTPPQVFNVTFLGLQDNAYGLLNALTVGPLLQSISPATANPGQVVNITLTCVNAKLVQDTARVWLTNNSTGCTDEILATSVVVNSANSAVATFTIPSNALSGLWDVNVIDDSKGYFYGYNMLTVTGTNAVSTISSNEIGNVSLYPNPSNGVFYMDMESGTKHNKMELFDISGKLIYSESFDSSNNTIRNYNFPQLSNGVYFVKISDGVASKVMKLAIIK